MVAGENRSCAEHKPKYPGAKVNCATCTRYDPNEEKCREEIWVGKWVVARYEDSEGFKAYDNLMRSNRGVVLD